MACLFKWRPGIGIYVTQRHCVFKLITAKSRTTKSIYPRSLSKIPLMFAWIYTPSLHTRSTFSEFFSSIFTLPYAQTRATNTIFIRERSLTVVIQFCPLLTTKRSVNLESNFWCPQFFKKTKRNSLSRASSLLRTVSVVRFLEELRKPYFTFENYSWHFVTPEIYLNLIM